MHAIVRTTVQGLAATAVICGAVVACSGPTGTPNAHGAEQARASATAGPTRAQTAQITLRWAWSQQAPMAQLSICAQYAIAPKMASTQIAAAAHAGSAVTAGDITKFLHAQCG